MPGKPIAEHDGGARVRRAAQTRTSSSPSSPSTTTATCSYRSRPTRSAIDAALATEPTLALRDTDLRRGRQAVEHAQASAGGAAAIDRAALRRRRHRQLDVAGQATAQRADATSASSPSGFVSRRSTPHALRERGGERRWRVRPRPRTPEHLARSSTRSAPALERVSGQLPLARRTRRRRRRGGHRRRARRRRDAAYMTPAFSSAGRAPFRRSLADRIVQSTVGMLVVALVLALVCSPARDASSSSPARRDSSASASSSPSRADGAGSTGQRRDRSRLYDRAERSLERRRWWSRFRMELELADITTVAVADRALDGLGDLRRVDVVSACSSGRSLALLGLVVPFVVRALVNRAGQRQRRRSRSSCPTTSTCSRRRFARPQPHRRALGRRDDAPEPSKSEFRRVIADEQLGVPLEDALQIASSGWTTATSIRWRSSHALQREIGSNAAEVLDRVVETVRERMELRRLVRTLTAQGRMSRWVLRACRRPARVSPCSTRLPGAAVSHGTGGFSSRRRGDGRAGSLVIRRIVDIKV